MTKRFVPVLLSAAGLFGVLSATPAHADLKVTWHMTMDGPMMKNMPPQAKTMMDGMMNPMTIFESGKKSRTDTPMMSIIIDRTADQSTMINKFAKSYYVSKFDPSKAGAGMPGNPMGGGEPADVKVDDTGKSKTILGHKCHEVIVTGKMKQQQGANMSFRDDMWIASDLAPMGAASGMPFGNFGSVASKIDGFPLEMSVGVSGGQADGMTMTFETTDLSTDSLPASTFEVPAGYTKSDNPGFGMGMGGPGMRRPGMGGM